MPEIKETHEILLEGEPVETHFSEEHGKVITVRSYPRVSKYGTLEGPRFFDETVEIEVVQTPPRRPKRKWGGFYSIKRIALVEEVDEKGHPKLDSPVGTNGEWKNPLAFQHTGKGMRGEVFIPRLIPLNQHSFEVPFDATLGLYPEGNENTFWGTTSDRLPKSPNQQFDPYLSQRHLV